MGWAMRGLQGRVAVVTGGGDGIGRGVCRRLAAEGVRVLVADLDPHAAERVAAELRSGFGAQARAEVCDVGVRADNERIVHAAVTAWGRLDILINNAWGGGMLGRAETKPDTQIEHGLAVGFRGPLWAMQAAFPVMRDAGYGRIVNMCSLNGVNAHIGTLEYNTAKEALRAATRTVAREWAAYGITANAVCPGAKTAAARRRFAENPELAAAADAANPMGRLGDPDTDIAPVVAFLASEDAQYLTGNTLFVDGGAHINGVPWAPQLPD
jgi:NAD(P)-dependent dehydrogenase (short-subunit alcohol dehydrogenase family)